MTSRPNLVNVRPQSADRGMLGSDQTGKQSRTALESTCSPSILSHVNERLASRPSEVSFIIRNRSSDQTSTKVVDPYSVLSFDRQRQLIAFALR